MDRKQAAAACEAGKSAGTEPAEFAVVGEERFFARAVGGTVQMERRVIVEVNREWRNAVVQYRTVGKK